RSPACRQRNRARLPSIPALCRLEFLTKQLAIQLLGTLMLFACLGEPPADCLEGLGTGGLGYLQPCLEHQVGELPLLLQATKDGADLANDQLKHRDLFVEQAEHLLLQGAARNQIEHEHLPVLADAIDAAYALFDRHRVPGDVEIDQGVAELDVAPLSARLR